MTIVTLVSVFDNAAASYDAPRVFPSSGVAIRAVTDLVNDTTTPSIPFRDHAEHFSLFALGDFDTETGRIVQYDAPKLLANFWELKKN